MPREIEEKILHFGGFKDCLDSIVDLMRSEHPCSVILRGNTGTGKKTAIREAERITATMCIYLNPFQCKEDQIAIRRIADKLGLAPRMSLEDLMDTIRKRPAKKDKLVFVLEDFPEFCRKRQYLLYNLLNLLQASSIKKDTGPNITLIGLTTDAEWSENVEKRVRSRLNAKCLQLMPPYRDFEEYVTFASILLNDYKIGKKSDLREQLSYMYHFGRPSVRYLKIYLMSICKRDDRGKLIVDFRPDAYISDYQRNLNVFSKVRLLSLTRPQLNFLKLAVYQYFDDTKHDLTIAGLKEFAKIRKWQDVAVDDSKLLSDIGVLLSMGLLDVNKIDQNVGLDTKIYPKLTPIEIKVVIEMDHSLRNIKTDSVWKRPKF